MKSKAVDPYCFPGTTVLRNLRGLMDKTALANAETMLSALGSEELRSNIPRLTDLNYLKLVHRTLFGQIYPWAGETRRGLGRMTKTRETGAVVLYGDCAYVDSELERVFGLLAKENYLQSLSLEAFAVRAAYFYGELDAIHAFREGNSRTLRAFFYSVAHNAGYKFRWALLGDTEADRQRLDAARDRAVMHGDSKPLAELFRGALSTVEA